MRYVAPVLIVVGAFGCPTANAFDLASIERTPPKLPELTGTPLHCLCVFGPEASTRVWLVRDGDVLYVDRNANGDLTEAGERIEADEKTSRPEDGVLHFSVPEITDGPRTHKFLGVSWFNVDHLKGDPGFPHITARFQEQPEFRALSISCDIEMPGHRGTGIDGRVTQLLTIGDINGILDFSPQAQNAPILHFGGPWQLTRSGRGALRIGRSDEFYLEVVTPGVGPGSMVSTMYDKLIPREARPHVEITFPAEGGQTLTKSYDFKQRCCAVNLYDAVDLPEGVVAGEAQVTMSLDGWAAGQVAASTHSLRILPALPGPKLLPISGRFKGTLPHAHPDGNISSIQFSPDGARLIASDYPGGVIHIWDLASGERLQTFETTKGLRAGSAFFHLSPDGQRVYAATNNRLEIERVERDGNKLNRVTYSDAVHVWDANTGERLHTWQQDPKRGILYLRPTADGRYLVVAEETPGEFEGRRPRAISLLDTATGHFRELTTANAYLTLIRDDNLAVVALPQTDGSELTSAVVLMQLPEWKEVTRIPIGNLDRAMFGTFAAGGTMLIGDIIRYQERDNWQDYTGELRVWDVATGKQLHAMQPQVPGARLTSYVVSPDGYTAVLGEFDQKTRASRLLLLNLHNWQTIEIPCEPGTYNRHTVFHPSGRWLVTTQLKLPDSAARRDPELSQLEQPRLQLIDTASGKILETMIIPQSFAMSIAFGPDGNTLATAGKGAVYLWDMTTSPGETLPEPAIGQPLKLAGTTVDGGPLAPSVHRGKVTLVSFWATWCAPCVAEMPELRAIYDRLHDRGFEIVGVSLDEPGVNLAEFARKQDLPWPVLHETSQELAGKNHPLARRLGVTAVPRSFLLDAGGTIIAIDPALHELTELVEQALPDAPSSAPNSN